MPTRSPPCQRAALRGAALATTCGGLFAFWRSPKTSNLTGETMLWTSGGRSPNLEDRRSTGGGIGRGLGIGGTVVVLALSLLFGRNLFNDLGVEPGVAASGAPMSAADSAAEEPEVQFISFVLDDVQNTWAKILPSSGTRFHPARLVLFRNSTDSGCGPAQSVMGPFYCPVDERVYLDLGFFDELKQRPGGGRRFRAGIRARARAWSPRSAPPRNRRESAPTAGVEPFRGEPTLRAARAPGGLLRRRLGALHRPAANVSQW
jgi:hypothetical protein